VQTDCTPVVNALSEASPSRLQNGMKVARSESSESLLSTAYMYLYRVTDTGWSTPPAWAYTTRPKYRLGSPQAAPT